MNYREYRNILHSMLTAKGLKADEILSGQEDRIYMDSIQRVDLQKLADRMASEYTDGTKKPRGI